MRPPSAPAPTAWTTLAAISTATPGASPHSTDPTLNPASPARNTRRRPSRSAQRPAGTSTAASTIVHAVEHPGQRAQAKSPDTACRCRGTPVDDEQIQAGHEHRQRQHADHSGDPPGIAAVKLTEPSSGVSPESGFTISC